MRTGMEQLEGRRLFASFTAASVSELIAAINAANLAPAADTITLVAGKTFSLTAVNNTTNGSTALPVIAANGGNLTIVGNGDTIERSSATGTPAFRLIDVATGASLTLKNLTLQGGLILSSPLELAGQGGGIRNQGVLNLDGVTVQRNTVQGWNGASYFPIGGDATGGGIYSSGTLTISGCAIQNNSAIGGRGMDGYFSNGGLSPGTGGAKAGSAGGSALGGGLYIAAGTLTMRNASVIANLAQGGAGGIGAGSKPDGKPGKGIGGGLYIEVAASAGLDVFSDKHIKQNTASTKQLNIFGTYSVLA